MAVDQSICSFEGCGRPINAKGLCKTHRTQQRKGQPLRPAGSHLKNVGKTCFGPECSRSATYKGLCRAHYGQYRSGKELRPLEARRPKARPGTICMFEGCGRPRKTWELCGGHYEQLVRKEPLRVLSNAEGEALRLFWSRVDKRSPHECWYWTGRLLNGGYGYANLDGKASTAHRIMWSLSYGDAPDGAVIDHTCSNRRCVNPEHLRMVTQQINAADRAYFPNNTSGYRNVYFDSNRKKWSGTFKYRYKTIYVGRFNTAEEAAEAVASRKLEMYGYQFRDSLDGTK